MGASAATPLCRETQSLGQQMLNTTVGINGLTRKHPLQQWMCEFSQSCFFVTLFLLRECASYNFESEKHAIIMTSRGKGGKGLGKGGLAIHD